MVSPPVKLGVPEESKDYAADASPIPRDAIEHDTTQVAAERGEQDLHGAHSFIFAAYFGRAIHL